MSDLTDIEEYLKCCDLFPSPEEYSGKSESERVRLALNILEQALLGGDAGYYLSVIRNVESILRAESP